MLLLLLLFPISSGIPAPRFTAADAASHEIVVGLAASLSGNWSSLGKETLNGATLAVEEVNRHGGVNGKSLRLLVQDSDEADSPRTLISVFRHLRSRGVQFIVGPNGTPGALALAPIASREDVLLVAPAIGVEEGVCSERKNFFNIQGGWESASRMLAADMVERKNLQVAVLASDHPFERRQADVFEGELRRLGGEILLRVDVPADESDVKAVLTKIILRKPEAVFLSVYNSLGPAAKQLRRLGYSGPVSTIQIDESRVRDADGALSNVRYARLATASAEFETLYFKRFQKRPDYPADFAFDAIMVLAEGLRGSALGTPEQVSAVLQGRKIQGASGTFRFNGCGHATRQPVISQYEERLMLQKQETRIRESHDDSAHEQLFPF